MAEPIDIQQALDNWLASNPAAQIYISKLYYVPDNHPVPADATHKVRLSSQTSAERQLTIAAVVKPEFAVFLDAILAMLATGGGTVTLPGEAAPEAEPGG
jgi:hypothetical protein